MEQKLYLEFRVSFNPATNQELLMAIGEAVKDRIHELFEAGEDEMPIPSIKDVTYEVVTEVNCDKS